MYTEMRKARRKGSQGRRGIWTEAMPERRVGEAS